MGHLRDRMDADLRLAGRSESTRKHYMGCATLFVKHIRRSPEEVGAAEVRTFLLSLVEERKLSRGRYLQYLAALKFLYGVTLGRPEVVAGIPYPKHRPARPTVMTREEIARVFAAAQTPFWRTYFMTAYAAGLRRMEVAGLRAVDIDSRSQLIRIVNGKGGKAREVMLDPELLQILRTHWRFYALPGPWLFPARAMFGWADHPINLQQASNEFRTTRIRAKISRPVTLHSLRHSFATHLLEDGGNVFVLQQVLGHAQLETTRGYVRVGTEHIRITPSPFVKLPK
jgi:integrase